MESAVDAELARALDGTPYRFMRLLGQGGMGVVVEAQHEALGAVVAVKLLATELDRRPESLERFRIEAQTLARLGHPGLVRVSDLGRTPTGRVYFVMERLLGRTLRAELDARGALPTGDAVRIAVAVLDALAAAHAAGIVHRDVKPENVFLEDDGRVRVLDFGVAKVLAEAADVPGAPSPNEFPTRSGAIVGTPPWVAPEQIGDGAVSPATDVYAVGLVLFRMLAGRHAFAGLSGGELLRAHLTTMPAPPSTWCDVSPALDAAVMCAIAKSPRDRYPDARAFADALRELSAWPGQVTGAIDARPEAGAQVRPSPDAVATITAQGELGELPRRARGVGVACLSLGLLDSTWRLVSIARTASALAGGSFVTALRASGITAAPPEALRQLALRSLPSTLLGAVLLLLTSSAGAWVGVRLLREGAAALARARAWSGFALAAAGIGLALDLTFALPAQLEFQRTATPMVDGQSMPWLASAGTALGVAGALAGAAAYLAWALVVRRLSR